MIVEAESSLELKLTAMRIPFAFYNRASLQLARWRFPCSPDWCRRIAFSESEAWEPFIRSGFAHWRIDIQFAKLTDLLLDDFDLVVPLSIKDALWLASQDNFNARNAIPVSPVEVIELCDNKEAFLNAALAAGFGSHLALNGPKSYPYILKKRRDSGSDSTQIVRSELDEERFRPLLLDRDYFTQRLVPGGKEFATHINFTDGKVVSELTVEYTFATDLPVKSKNRDIRRYVRCPDLPVLVSMLRALKYEGLCCFNYKVLDGVVTVFELNPRFGGSLCPIFFAFVGAIRDRRGCGQKTGTKEKD
jgi:hypothetical protein